MGVSLKSNPLTEIGYNKLDDLVANVLKRGRNGEGYECGVRFEKSTGMVETTMTIDEATRIRTIVDGTKPALASAVEIAGVINEVRVRAVSNQATGIELK